MIACTAGGASIGAIARPLGVSVACLGSGERPLAVSSWRTTVSLTGWATPPVEAGPTLTTAGALLAAAADPPPAPATGSTAWGWACGAAGAVTTGCAAAGAIADRVAVL